ncbi:MAG: hypothetical protein C5B49_03090, partial [Bdellovibrio sp.]
MKLRILAVLMIIHLFVLDSFNAFAGWPTNSGARTAAVMSPFQVNLGFFTTRNRPESYRLSQVAVYCGLMGTTACIQGKASIKEYVEKGEVTPSFAEATKFLGRFLDLFPNAMTKAGKAVLDEIGKPGSPEKAGLTLPQGIDPDLLRSSIASITSNKDLREKVFDGICQETFNFNSNSDVSPEFTTQKDINQILQSSGENTEKLAEIQAFIFKTFGKNDAKFAELIKGINDKMNPEGAMRLQREVLGAISSTFQLASLLAHVSGQPELARSIQIAGTITTTIYANYLVPAALRPSPIGMYANWVTAVISIANLAIAADSQTRMELAQIELLKSILSSLNDLHIHLSHVAEQMNQGFIAILEGIAANKYSMDQLRTMVEELQSSVNQGNLKADFGARVVFLNALDREARGCELIKDGVSLLQLPAGSENDKCNGAYLRALHGVLAPPWLAPDSTGKDPVSLLRGLSLVSTGLNSPTIDSINPTRLAVQTPFSDLNPLVDALIYLQDEDSNHIPFNLRRYTIYDDNGKTRPEFKLFNSKAPRLRLPNVSQFYSVVKEALPFNLANFDFINKQDPSEIDRSELFEIIRSNNSAIQRFFKSTVGSQVYMNWLRDRLLDSYRELAKDLSSIHPLVVKSARKAHADLVAAKLKSIFHSENGRPVPHSPNSYGDFSVKDVEYGSAEAEKRNGPKIALPEDISKIVPDDLLIGRAFDIGTLNFEYSAELVEAPYKAQFGIRTRFHWPDDKTFLASYRKRKSELVVPNDGSTNYSTWTFGDGLKWGVGWTNQEPLRDNFSIRSTEELTPKESSEAQTNINQLWAGRPGIDDPRKSIYKIYAGILHGWMPPLNETSGSFREAEEYLSRTFPEKIEKVAGISLIYQVFLG